ncbi:MAG: isoleucine--tRNA ligase [Myxococcota bacterium]
MFDPVSPQVSFPELDADVQTHWDDQKIFEATLAKNKDGKPFVFYEGPPTANGMPHAGHVLTRVMKDVFLRYRSMRGQHVPRRAGWDTHGLPVEVEVEKALGISGRQAIAEYGIMPFTKKCIESVFTYTHEWEKMTRRIGFWVDVQDAYVTFHKSYVESVWWALKTLFEKGLLYQSYKVVWWWPQGGTALSSGEVGQGYKTIDDPSVMVRFPLKDDPNRSFLAWTTTPWTLPSNIALAVRPSAPYATVKLEDGSEVVVAEALVEAVLGDTPHEVLETKPGSEWVGTAYEPPFRYAEPEGGPAHHVIAGDFVELKTGSGLVHLAPAFGEDDSRVCKAEGLGFLQLVQPDGTFPPEVTDFAGRFCKEADRDIIRNLKKRGILFKEEVYRHEYPFSWRRMSDPLIQYARDSWFIKTTREIHRVQENNQQVNWEPEHIKDGRFGQFLAGNVDWALSRERFWGTPLPIWINDETGEQVAIGSAAEILEKNPNAFDAFREAQAKDPSLSDHLMVHKPWIDDVTWTEPGKPGVFRRVSEVIDCWFDSGCMPFAQWGYPHQNKEAFEACFPADFITEAVDQTRGWFYSLITISTLLFEDADLPHPYRNCAVLGLLNDEKGRKMSKSLQNYTDPLELMEKVGADAVRWALYTATVPGQDTRFFDRATKDAISKFLLKLWNAYTFFVQLANIDGWDPSGERPALAERHDMDRWILAELDYTVEQVGKELDAFKSHLAVRHLDAFVDALSNWYLRRSKPRFWEKDASADKAAAFATLYEVLTETVRLAAPFIPFMSEAIYRNLTKEDSVHLADYPAPDASRQDDALRQAVALSRAVVAAGLRVRGEAKLKVRQPLAKAIVVVAGEEERRAVQRFEAIIREELNVEEVIFSDEPATYVDFQLLPNFRALGPRLGKDVPVCKKVLAAADGSALYAEMTEKGSITVELPSGSVELGPDEIQVRLQAKEGFAAAAEQGHVVVLDTTLTPELERAGLAREVVNRINKARKEMDLPIGARIRIGWSAESELGDAIREHSSKIAAETLASELHEGEIDGTQHESTVGAQTLRFAIATT